MVSVMVIVLAICWLSSLIVSLQVDDTDELLGPVRSYLHAPADTATRWPLRWRVTIPTSCSDLMTSSPRTLFST